jgi:uncharacterized protein YpmB
MTKMQSARDFYSKHTKAIIIAVVILVIALVVGLSVGLTVGKSNSSSSSLSDLSPQCQAQQASCKTTNPFGSYANCMNTLNSVSTTTCPM